MPKPTRGIDQYHGNYSVSEQSRGRRIADDSDYSKSPIEDPSLDRKPFRSKGSKKPGLTKSQTRRK